LAACGAGFLGRTAFAAAATAMGVDTCSVPQ